MKKLWVLSAIMMLLTACQESLEDRCAREAKEYTRKNCPAKMDNNSILDSLTFERETHTLHYYYRLTGFACAGHTCHRWPPPALLPTA